MISILMPVKNAAPYLNQCIDSIVNQSIKEWELIAVNDHSTDNSLEILKDWAVPDDRIKVYNNTEKGIITALSLAFAKSQGDFITRMDADDIMNSQKLELLLTKLEENPNAVITNKVEYFSDHELGEGYLKYADWLNNLIDTDSHYQHIYRECVLPSPSWIMKRETLELIGGFSSLNYPEDYDLCFKIYEQRIKIIGLPQVLHLWRDYTNRTSRTDENYADNTFIPLKVKYFLACDYSSTGTLALWGAGKKGKRIAHLLVESNIPFVWYTNNPNKIGHTIHQTKLLDYNEMKTSKNLQVIIAIADKQAGEAIKSIEETLDADQIFHFS